MSLDARQQAWCHEHPWDFSNLSALFLNCTLKRRPERSNNEGLMDVAREIMEANGVAVEIERPVDYALAPGIYPDMTEHGAERDDWPELYALQHLGFVVPPQAEAGCVGEAGPGPSYLDEGSGAPQNAFTQRNVTFMTWKLLHLARLLREAGGVPAHGNQRSQREAGCGYDHPNPEFR